MSVVQVSRGFHVTGERTTALRPLPVLVVAAGAPVAAIVGSDGTPHWAAVRVAAVVLVTAFAVSSAGRQASRRRGVGVLAFGVACTVVGAGIAPPHLSKSGPSFLAVAGLIALLGGLALVGVGIVLVSRAMRPMSRAAVGAAVVVGLVLAVYVAAIPIAAVNVPPTSLKGRSPSDVGLVARDVAIVTSDGVDLAGWYVPTVNGAAVVLRHGAGSTRASTLSQAAVLARHGYGVLLIDARGHGESSGRAMDFGWFGDVDTEASVSFLAGQAGVDPDRIGAVGLSMGGEEVIGAAAADPRIRAVVAEGATGRTAADKRWLADEYGARGWIQLQIERLQTTLTNLLTSADPPTSLSVAVERRDAPPTLLVAAGAMADEVEVARRLSALNPTRVSSWTVADAGHTGGLTTDPAGWEATVVGFLDRTLGRG